MIKMDTLGMFNVIDRTIGSKNIEELKKPFMAVATEVESGDEYVFKSGSVATALCASSSYPPFFKPVVIDNVRYIDGAFTNSVPADLVRNMGADYVVAIDLSTHEKKQGGFLSRIIPTYKGKVENPWQKGYDYSDIVLKPDLSAYKPVSIGSASVMYEIGYECAIKNIPQIKKDLELIQKNKYRK
jgi:NTE family protein